jgi:hypothetical protein
MGSSFSETKMRITYTLFVSTHGYRDVEQRIWHLLEKTGQIEPVKIITDISTGRSIGFVEMVAGYYTEKAGSVLHGDDVIGRPLTVDKARPRETAVESARVRQGKFKRRGSGLGNWR